MNTLDLTNIHQNYISFGLSMVDEEDGRNNYLSLSVYDPETKQEKRFYLPIKESAELLLCSGLAKQVK